MRMYLASCISIAPAAPWTVALKTASVVVLLAGHLTIRLKNSLTEAMVWVLVDPWSEPLRVILSVMVRVRVMDLIVVLLLVCVYS